MVGIRKFVNEFLQEWPILFMDDYRAKEWLSEKEGLKYNVSPATAGRIDTHPTPVIFSHSSHEDLFEDICGLEDIKVLFRRAISSEKQIHILLVGPPACAKSSFMQELSKLGGSYYTIGSNSTKSGMVDALFETGPRFLIIDELEKMSVKDQTVLLSLMEGGLVSETKHKRTRRTQLNTSVFAAANSTDNLLTPLLTRFCRLHLKPYSFEEFNEITKRVLNEREEIDVSTAEAIANAVWNKMKSANVRDCVRIGRLVKSQNDVNEIIEVMRKYENKILQV